MQTSNVVWEERPSAVVGLVMNVVKAVFSWITNKMDKLYQKRYGKAYEMFSSDEKYQSFYSESEKSIKRLYSIIGAAVIVNLLYGLTKEDIFLLFLFIPIICMAVVTIGYAFVYIYGFMKSNWKDIAIKLVTGLAISIIVICLTMIFPPLGIALIAYTIYKNWQRRAFLDKYKRYTRFLLKGTFVLIVFNIIGSIFEAISKVTEYEMGIIIAHSNGMMSPSQLHMIDRLIWSHALFSCLSLCVFCIGWIILSKINIRFYSKEQARGIKYDDCVKLTWLVPLTWIMLAFSVITLVHSSIFNADSMLADIDSANLVDTDITDVGVDATKVDADVTNLGLSANTGDETQFTIARTDDISNTGDTGTKTPIEPNNVATENVKDASNAAFHLNIDDTSKKLDISSNNINATSTEFGEPTQSTNNPVMSFDTPTAKTTNVFASSEGIDTNTVHNSVPETTGEVANDIGHDQLGSLTNSAKIYDENGFTQGRIVKTGEYSYALQDDAGMHIGSAHVDNITGNISIHDALDLQQGTITKSGVIQGIDGLADGYIVTLQNGDMVIQDSTKQTIGHLLKNGICTDKTGLPVGSIKLS